MKESQYDFQIGDWVTIIRGGRGCNPDVDQGLTAQIVDNKSTKGLFKGYTIEIDRDKSGNNDRYAGPESFRLATEEEIIKAGGTIKTLNYEIY